MTAAWSCGCCCCVGRALARTFSTHFVCGGWWITRPFIGLSVCVSVCRDLRGQKKEKEKKKKGKDILFHLGRATLEGPEAPVWS